MIDPDSRSSDNVFTISVCSVDLVAMSEVPHPIPFRTRSLSPPEPMVLRLKARESRSPPGLPGGQRNEDKSQIRTSRTLSSFRSNPLAAGLSSPVARQAHNLKVVGSNPTPATKKTKAFRGFPKNRKNLGAALVPQSFPRRSKKI